MTLDLSFLKNNKLITKSPFCLRLLKMIMQDLICLLHPKVTHYNSPLCTSL